MLPDRSEDEHLVHHLNKEELFHLTSMLMLSSDTTNCSASTNSSAMTNLDELLHHLTLMSKSSAPPPQTSSERVETPGLAWRGTHLLFELHTLFECLLA